MMYVCGECNIYKYNLDEGMASWHSMRALTAGLWILSVALIHFPRIISYLCGYVLHSICVFEPCCLRTTVRYRNCAQ